MEFKKEVILRPKDLLNFLNSRANEENCLYRYESEAFHFSCTFKVDSDQNIHVIEMNDLEFKYVFKSNSKQEDIELFLLILLMNKSFLPELYDFKDSEMLLDLTIKDKSTNIEIEYNNVLFLKKSLYLLGLKPKGKEYLNEYYYEKHFFDSIKEINLCHTFNIDLVVFENIAYIYLLLKNGESVQIQKRIYGKEDFEFILNFKINVEKKIKELSRTCN